MSAVPRSRVPRPAGAITLAGVAVGAGVGVGIGTSYGQGYLGTPLSALVNSASAWLVAPFLVGMLARVRRGAAATGLVCCLLQLVAYDVCSHLRGFGVDTSRDVFWGVAAVIGGPLFGLAGHAWRFERPGVRGIGPATLASAFAAEGLWTYAHQLHETSTAILWLAIAVAIALVGLRGLRGWRWVVLTLPLGLIAEVALTRIYL